MLADLDLEGAGKLGESGYVGVLREELGGELKDVRTCRLQVFQQLLASVAAPEREPARPPPPAPEIALRPWCVSARLNPTERAICGDQCLARLDADLEAVYGQAKASRTDSEQGAWLLARDACGADLSCIARSYSERIWGLQN